MVTPSTAPSSPQLKLSTDALAARRWNAGAGDQYFASETPAPPAAPAAVVATSRSSSELDFAPPGCAVCDLEGAWQAGADERGDLAARLVLGRAVDARGTDSDDGEGRISLPSDASHRGSGIHAGAPRGRPGRGNPRSKSTSPSAAHGKSASMLMKLCRSSPAPETGSDALLGIALRARHDCSSERRPEE